VALEEAGLVEAESHHERLLVLLQRCDLAGQYQRAARARQLSVHQIELMALEHLATAGGLTPGELGHRLGLTSGGVTALSGRLMEAGYVAREPHPSDRRMRILVPTDDGRAQVHEQLQPVLAPADRAVSWLSDADAALVERFLDSLVLLKENEAAATPGPEPARIRDRRRRPLWGQLAPSRYGLGD
jgi:DNA-binding MarR family transcriptional regulator